MSKQMLVAIALAGVLGLGLAVAPADAAPLPGYRTVVTPPFAGPHRVGLREKVRCPGATVPLGRWSARPPTCSSRWSRAATNAAPSSSPATAASSNGGDILGDAMIAAALIDRLVHHATLLTLKGKSYRLRQRSDPAAARAAG